MSRSRLRLLIVLVLPLLWVTAALAGPEKYNSSLRLLRHIRATLPGKTGFEPQMAAAVDAEKAVVTVKFDHPLSGSEIALLERTGVEFFYIDGKIARTRSMYPARIPWPQLDSFSDRSEVIRLESAWRPCIYPTLDVSGPEIEADSCWAYVDPLGLPISGKGRRIADFDTGIDVFHPSFFFADGDTLDWIDVDNNHSFTPGTDCVDLNDDGLPGGDEKLRFVDGWVWDIARVFGYNDKANSDNVYQTYWDWLYADVNNNSVRNFGPSDGFGESDPTFGEPWFIALDDNENGALDRGEKLVALGTSKIPATLNTGSVERTRGVDLIQTEDDTNGHGTSVSGILAGGTARRHLFAGVAPDAELLPGNVFSDVPLSYLIPWARSRGADVMLYEYGSYTYEFLDGSSLEEELVTAEHSNINQVTPSGNLARGGKHAVVTIAGLDSVSLKISVPIYNGNILRFYSTTIWRPDAHTNLIFRLKYPQGIEWTLADSVSYVYNYEVWYDRDVSPRRTYKFNLFVDRGYRTHVVGNWELKIVNNSFHPVEIISNVADDNSSWAGGTEFQNYVSNTRNVTSPATADSSLVNGSYSTRGFESYGGVGGGSVPPGEISAFSGRGKRIDGASQLDVCSPGNYDVYTTRTHTDGLQYPPGCYRQFSGTSAAGPHVAAAAALIHQAYLGIKAGQVEHLIKAAALSDGFTGSVPNETWGYGKLRILAAMRVATAIEEMADGKKPPQLFLGQNYPNPFNPTTWIPFFVPQDGNTRLTIYDVRGRVVRVLRDRWYRQGPHSVVWNGRDDSGNPVVSGVYFSVLRQVGLEQTRKMVLLR